MVKQVRALILADDCNPDWPSLPVVGYKAARAIAEVAEVTVATHVRNRESIERDGLGRARVVYVDNERIARPLYRLNTWLRGGTEVGWTTSIALNYPTYLAFEWQVYRALGAALRAGEFDVVHRLTPMSPTLPSPMALLSPVPFVLGPLNGGLPWPREYAAERAREKEWLVKLRDAYRLLPFYRTTYARSAVVLSAFAHTRADLPKSARQRAIDFPEVGIDPELFAAGLARPERPASAPLTFLFAGRLVPYKLPSLVVDCFARSPALRRHRLLIAGDGPERDAMQRQIADHGLEGCVQMLGRLSQAEVGERMRQSDVFVFPSIRELGAGVVAEAMASGLCCVAVDYGGPAELLDEGRGVLIPVGPREQLVSGFTDALERLAENPARVQFHGERGRRYALDHLTWAAKARRMLEVYRFAMGQRDEPPAYPDPVARGASLPRSGRMPPSRPRAA